MGRTTGIADNAENRTAYTYDKAGNILSETDALKRTTHYTYDKFSRLIQVTRPDESTITYTYDSVDRLTSATDAAGTVTTYEYDILGNLIKMTENKEKVYTYAYDTMDRLAAITTPLKAATAYTYDALSRLIKETSPEGIAEEYIYDALNRPTKYKDGNGHITEYTYDALDNLLAEISPLGAKTTYTYNKHGELTGVTDPLGHTTVYDVDLNGYTTKITQPNGGSYTYAYDAVGRLTKATTPLGHVRSFEYDVMDNLVKDTDALNGTTAYTYDVLGRLVKVTDAGAGVTSYTYDAYGNITGYQDALGHKTGYAYDLADERTAVTDALGQTTAFTYDPVGNLTGVTLPGGRSASYTYDKNGNVVSATDPMGNVTAMAYDKNDRLTAVTDALKQTESYTYDAHNNLIKKTGATGRVTNYAYDAAGNLTKVTDPAGNVTTYTYDSMNDLTAFTDTLGHTTRYTYDLEGNMTAIEDAMDRVEHMTYDTLGRQTSYTDNSGKTIVYDYDKLNALIEKSYEDADGAAMAEAVSYGYDSTGQRVRMADASGTSTYAYDALGRITKVTDGSGKSIQYSYNAANELETITYPDGTKISYGYDKNGNLTKVTDADQKDTVYVYDALDRVTEIRRPGGTKTTVAYDAGDRIVSLTTTDADGGEISYYTYTYDSRGFIIKEVGKETTGAQKPGNHYGWNGTGAWGPNGHKGSKVTETQILREYTYDAQGRLTGCTESAGDVENTYAYTYDAAGNRQSYKETSGGKVVSEKTYTYNAANQLTACTESAGKKKTTTTYTYDAAGNCIGEDEGKTTTTYEYTVENRLKAVTQGKTLLMAVAYDGDGNRIFQVDYDKDNGKSIRSVKLPENTGSTAKELYEMAYAYPGNKFTLTEYINDVNRDHTETLMVYDAFTGKVSQTYTYGNQRESIKTSSGTGYYLYDRQGSVTDILGSGKAPSASYTYDAFGQVTAGAPAYGNMYGYTGESYNVATGYLYLRARYYDTGMGQFTSEDSYLGDITEPSTLNRYAYGVGNPMNYTDPTGHEAENESYGGMTPSQRKQYQQNKVVNNVAARGTKAAEATARKASQMNYKNRSKQQDNQVAKTNKSKGNTSPKGTFSRLVSECGSSDGVFRPWNVGYVVNCEDGDKRDTELEPVTAFASAGVVWIIKIVVDLAVSAGVTAHIIEGADRALGSDTSVGQKIPFTDIISGQEVEFGTSVRPSQNKIEQNSGNEKEVDITNPNSNSDKDKKPESGGYEIPDGGGGVSDSVKVDNKEVNFGHGGRHLEGTELSVKEVNQAIANDVVTKNLEIGQFYKGHVEVDGIIIEYTSYGVKDGVINIGTYFPVK